MAQEDDEPSVEGTALIELTYDNLLSILPTSCIVRTQQDDSALSRWYQAERIVAQNPLPVALAELFGAK